MKMQPQEWGVVIVFETLSFTWQIVVSLRCSDPSSWMMEQYGSHFIDTKGWWWGVWVDLKITDVLSVLLWPISSSSLSSIKSNNLMPSPSSPSRTHEGHMNACPYFRFSCLSMDLQCLGNAFLRTRQIAVPWPDHCQTQTKLSDSDKWC